MDKDFNLKNDPRYQTAHLRDRITKTIKRIRDEAEEVKESQGKTLTKRGMSRYKDNKAG